MSESKEKYILVIVNVETGELVTYFTNHSSCFRYIERFGYEPSLRTLIRYFKENVTLSLNGINVVKVVKHSDDSQ